jgi:isochorismate synthase EntC
MSAGDVEQDFWLAFDLLRSAKDHAEFTVVRECVRDALREVADDVRVDRKKSVLKQAAVQHLYGRLSATLRPGCGDAELLVRPASDSTLDSEFCSPCALHG